MKGGVKLVMHNGTLGTSKGRFVRMRSINTSYGTQRYESKTASPMWKPNSISRHHVIGKFFFVSPTGISTDIPSVG